MFDELHHHRAVAHGCVHAAVLQFFQQEGQAFEAGYFRIGGAQEFGGGQIAGVAGYHAYAVEVFQIFHGSHLFAFGHGHYLGDFKVGVGEEHALLAFGGDGYGSHYYVGIAVAQAVEKAVPRLVFKFHAVAGFFG